MPKALFIIIFGILVYLGVATVISDESIIGRFGAIFAIFNHEYFGYLSYIYLFVLNYPLYIVYKYPKATMRGVEASLGFLLVFWSLIVVQAILVTNLFRGSIGAGFVDYLSPFIGLFGVWIFFLICLSVGLTLLFEQSLHEYFTPLKIKFEELKKSLHVRSVKREEVKKNELKSKIQNSVKEKTEATTATKIITKKEQLASKDMKAILEEPSYLRDYKETQDEAFEIKLIKKEQATELKASKDDDVKIIQAPEDEESTIVSIAKKVKQQKNTLIVDELEENTKLLETMEMGKVEKPKNFKLPSADFLQKAPQKTNTVDEVELDDKIKDLIAKLAHFNIDGDVIRTCRSSCLNI